MRDETIDAIQRVLNLSKHPLFQEQPELPAWAEAIHDLREQLEKEKESFAL